MKMIMLALCMLVLASTCMAELVQEAPQYPNNTGALATGEEAADIVSENSGGTVGAQEGEITLYRSSVGVDVYSGYNKVESITNNSDGWVGGVDIETNSIKFTPAGRPQLDCPAQSLANWYGPCKLVQGS